MSADGAGVDERCLGPARPDVIDEVVAGEAVIVHLGTGRYYALNPSATELWSAFDGGASSGALLGQVPGASAAWSDAAGALVRTWVDEGLLVDAPAPSASPSAALAAVDGASGIPEMRVFTDLEDLLLLDPIHDVTMGDDGFPIARSPG